MNRKKITNATRYSLPLEQQTNNYNTECGLGSCKPDGLQCCASIGCFTFTYGFSAVLTSSLHIYIMSQITTLEKQFGFSSSVSGLILSSNDMGYLLTTLFMSYIARRTHIPRVLALSTIFYGLSGLLCSIPHFLNVDSFRLNDKVDNISTSVESPLRGGALCLNSSIGLNITDHCSGDAALANKDGTARTVAILCLAIGMGLQGFGKSPRYPFLATYVDDNVEQTRTPLYLGIISGMGILGPALGFTLGGLFSRLYVTLEETSMSVRDPRWIGAWWLGFLFFGTLGIIVGLPLLFFPRRMKTRPKHLDELKRKTDMRISKDSVCFDFKELLKSVLRLLTTPIYLLCNLSTCVLLFAISGMLAFLAKYLESQYNIPTWKANILLGTINVFGASLGVIFGGCITSRLKLSPLTCIKFVTGLSFLSIFTIIPGFFVGCPSPVLYMGVNGASNYSSNLDFITDNTTLSPSYCDATTCMCDDRRYFPVCGSDKKSYFSPCHAGCSDTEEMVFVNCSCIDVGATAVPGLCDGECDTMLWIYMALNFIGAFTTTMTIMPSFVVYIRSIREADKPLGVGMSAFLNTLLGFFPGAVVYGKVIDTTCIIWSVTCSGDGSCSLYDTEDFRIKYHLLFTMCKIGSFILYFIAMLVALKTKQPFFVDSDRHDATAESEPFTGNKEAILKTKGTKV